MTTPMIEFRHVKKEFDNTQAVKDLSFIVPRGELFVLVGTSGSGKTTTLKMINQLIVQTSGDILIDDKRAKDYDLRQLRLNIGYVLQQIALFPTMTVKQNVAVILELKHVAKKDIDQRVDELLRGVDLDPEQYRDRYPRELSGGEQQRIGIIRAMAANPPVILFDEPFSALDPIVRNQLQDLVRRLHQRYQTTIVFVTHDMDEALKLGDRIGVMSHGELLQVGTPTDIAQHPVNKFVEDFFAATVGKNLYDTPVDKIIKTGYQIKQPTQTENIPTVSREATLEEVFAILANEAVVEVHDESTNPVGWLDRQSIMRYLSEVKH
ncbi:ABC transporter ATP-binding protein [Lentilactobacillus kribbianus]|uniref:ABC transporter ATP-binding protein n=1 Tax=Lentilactobacillus kribbianus TaxID=2729622 RepID=UPI001552A08E|nr:ABC transporter ATP-binding protein [Lentilactobacillus kribbianus]